MASTPPAAQVESPASAARVALNAELDEQDLWLTPVTVPAEAAELGRAVEALASGRASAALPMFLTAVNDPVVGGYARLYAGRAALALERADEAEAAARELLGPGRVAPDGYLREAALWLAADAAERRTRWPQAIAALEELTQIEPANPAEVFLRLGLAAVKAGDSARAREAFTRVYDDFPLSEQAALAEVELARLPGPASPERVARDLERAGRLFGGRRYTDALEAFTALRPSVTGDDRALVDLRIAQSQYHLRRHTAARQALDAYLGRWSLHRPEAEYALVSTLRALGAPDYPAQVRAFVERHAADPLAEAALNDLGTHYILTDEDASAAQVFGEMYRRYPRGQFADRAAWRAGWWAYRHDDYRTAIRLFESAAAEMRRANYRPAWLYWAARAHEHLGDDAAAVAGYRQAVHYYRNSYYGRLATDRLDRMARLTPAGMSAAAGGTRPPLTIAAGNAPASASLVRALLGAGLYDDAVLELRHAERRTGTSPLLEASIAHALHLKGELRPAITAMRRAYPQFMAEGGEFLPHRMLRVIFPLDYWDLLRRHAEARDLDPYLVAALVSQESTFQADVRSAANAWGLMQILPSTGRRYAARLGIRPFSTARLTSPEVNVRIGTTYFSELLAEFGSVAHALAAYNAGENRVRRWRAERPGIDTDEFVDDIPFPETQNYVKRIVGTTEDYRILYGAATADDRSRPRR